jgi:hypothetical protein
MEEISPLFYVNVGPQGTFKGSGDYRTGSGDIDAIFQHIRDKNVPKLALHFHGGLVPEAAGMGIARKMIPVYQAAGSHPVTFVWETGFLETLKSNLATIHHTALFRKVLFWTLKKAGKELGVDATGKGMGAELDDKTINEQLLLPAPFASLAVTGTGGKGGAGPLTEASLPDKEDMIAAELESEMAADHEFQALLQSPSPDAWTKMAARRLEPATATAEPGKGLVGLTQAFVAVAKIATRVLKRTIQRHDHGFYPTVVEEILRELYLDDFGAWVWDGMKNQAEAMWRSNQGVSGDARHAGRYFLDGLRALQQETGLIVDLVGHSAGSIAICHMLKAAAASGGLKVRNVLLLAPAARVDLFHSELVSRKDEFNLLRIFTMQDALECDDRLVDGIYTRSLLYFISGVLERGDDVPLCGLAHNLIDNDLYRDDPLPAIRAAFGPPSDNWLVLSRTAGGAAPDRRSGATSHGGFDDDDPTKASLTHILAQ